MKAIKSNYWNKVVKIPFKYRKCDGIIKCILNQVENDRDEGISISKIDIDYNIKFKYLILECLEKYFELKLITIPSFKRIGKNGYSKFYLVDIKSRLESWYKKCLLSPEKAINLVYNDFNSKIRNFIDLYNSGVCEMTYVFSLPHHIVGEVIKKISNDYHYTDIKLFESPEYILSSYDIDNLSAITITHCYDKDNDKQTSPVHCYDAQEHLQIKRKDISENLSLIIDSFIHAYNEDVRDLNGTKKHKLTVINCKENNIKFSDEEFDLIKKLMLRKGYAFSIKEGTTREKVITISYLDNKEKRVKDFKSIIDVVEDYGFYLEKLDYSMIENNPDKYENVIKGNYANHCYNTVIRNLVRYYEGLEDI